MSNAEMSNAELIARALTGPIGAVPLPRQRPQAAIAADLLGQGVIGSPEAADLAANFAKQPPDSWERLQRAQEMLKSGLMTNDQFNLYMKSIGR